MGGVVAVFWKQPAEILERSHDWSNDLKTGVTIDEPVAISALRLDTMADVTDDIIAASSVVGNASLYTVKAGENGINYKITLRMTRSDGKVYEDDLVMRVREV